MATNSEVRCFSIYVDDEKIAEAFSNNYNIKFGRKEMFTAEGVVYSKGQVITDLSFEAISPTTGMKSNILRKALAQADVEIGVNIDGGALLQTMAIMEVGYKGETAEGTLVGSWKLGGGKPTQQKV